MLRSSKFNSLIKPFVAPSARLYNNNNFDRYHRQTSTLLLHKHCFGSTTGSIKIPKLAQVAAYNKHGSINEVIKLQMQPLPSVGERDNITTR